MSTNPLCSTCGTQFPPADPPEVCPICADERQYLPPGGQRWTTLDRLRAGRANTWRTLEPGLFAIHTEPGFAIGQRALLLRSPGGNVLFDCIALLDEATVTLIRALGGLAAIAISHPHYYTTMVEWAHAFEAPVFLHADDRSWVMRPDPSLRFWDAETCVLHDGITLIRIGGHFDGATVLHWPAGSNGDGALLVGDVIAVVQDRRHVTFMRSYPNFIPLPPSAVRRAVAAIDSFPFDRVYGAFPNRDIVGEGKAAILRSARRYISWSRDEG